MLKLNKIVLGLSAVILVGCHSTQSVVRTTKKPTPKVAHHTKKPAQGQTKATESAQSSEVIVSTSKTVVTSDVIKNYVWQYKDIAMNNMKTYGIPASIILAQGILESGAGNGQLARTANNHFGIKCHKGWAGESVRHDDDEAQECFRKYVDPSESYKDHALFLTGRARYANLFELPKDDYKAWAKTLRADGYATDPRYPEKLISYIEKYKLHLFDAEVLTGVAADFEKPAIRQADAIADDSDLYEVQKGDTLYSISKKFNLTVDELRQKNNMAGSNALSIGQKLKV